MPTSAFVVDRIGRLKVLDVQWTTELQQLGIVDPDRAVHLAEAIQDLRTVISDLERANPSSSARAWSSRP